MKFNVSKYLSYACIMKKRINLPKEKFGISFAFYINEPKGGGRWKRW